MKKALIFLTAVLMLSGCDSKAENSALNDPPSDPGTNYSAESIAELSETEISAELISFSESEGVFYPPRYEREIGLVYKGDLPLWDYLYYDGSVYTTSYRTTSFNESEITELADSIIGNELADIYNNEIYWSEDSSKLFTFSENVTAALYSMNGYDSSFRVCLVYSKYIPSMDETVYGMSVFNRLNGITLNKGNELFKERLHLDEYYEAYAVNYDKNKGEYTEEIITEDLSEFLQAVFDGEFVEADYNIREEFKKKKCYELLLYTDSEIGLKTALDIYSDGYVSMYSADVMFLEKIDPDACDKIAEILSGISEE